jgi:hypothetical protein
VAEILDMNNAEDALKLEKMVEDANFLLNMRHWSLKTVVESGKTEISLETRQLTRKTVGSLHSRLTEAKRMQSRHIRTL